MANVQYPQDDNGIEFIGDKVTVISPFYTKQQVADIFQISVRQVSRRMKTGYYKFVKDGHRVLFPKDHIQAKMKPLN